MKSRDFCYWLQGYLEIHGTDKGSLAMSDAQVALIQKHLAMVFRHEIDPGFGSDNADLNEIHDGGSGGGTIYRC